MVQNDRADVERFTRLAALLDQDWQPGCQTPALAHFVLFRPWQRQSEIGHDGHAMRTAGGILPDIALPRRMWAGSRIVFHREPICNETLVRRSSLLSAQRKSGKSGDMLFCTVLHHISTETGADPVITEEQDIVFRQGHSGIAARPAIAPSWSPLGGHRYVVDPVMLLRYSALTFNGHRIHYDRDYARLEEGYGGLVVHGPLLATLLLNEVHRLFPGRKTARFDFRAGSPLFDGEEVVLAARVDCDRVDLQAVGPIGQTMVATAHLAPER
jgi:3-methylfumaryl-CoA hydratase